MTTPTKQKEYDTLLEYHEDVVTWTISKSFYEYLNLEIPPEPVWNPSSKFVKMID